MSKRITSWSFSRWSDWDKCPQLARFKHVDKLKEPENEAMRGGTKAHNELAAFLSEEKPVPQCAARFEDLLQTLKTLEPVHDQEWGFTQDWKVTSWFGRDTWFRSKLDACIVYSDNTADVVDFKTGKESPTHGSQAELYAVSVFVRYRNVTHVVVRFWYLDTGIERVYHYAREDNAEMIRKWEKRTAPMLADEIFAPKPGQHCRWCAFAKSKAGPCKFG